VADSQYPYPPDRFDHEAADVAFHGAHRAEEPFWRQNLVYLVIIAVAAVVLVVLLFVIGGLGPNGDDRGETPPAASETGTTAPEESDGGGESTEEPTEEPAEADKTVEVQVLNAAGINGLAARWQENLTGSGWENVTVSTAQDRQTEAVVFYRDEADKATAQALAEEVGAGEARQSDEYEAPITFVTVGEPEE
jgi:hypothetical protein